MKLAFTSLLLVSGLFLAGCGFTLAADVTPPPGYSPPPEMQAPAQETAGPLYPLVPPDPANGAPIFAEKCAPCHGASGLGDGERASALPNPVTALGSPEVARQAIPARWYEVVSNGNLERFMPPFQSLTERQRWDVVAYALNLIQSPASLEQGAELYQANCAGCHGESGAGDGPEVDGVKMPDFTHQESMALKSQADLHQTISNGAQGMPAFGEKLSDSERWTLAGYLRQFSLASSGVMETGAVTPDPGEAATPVAAIPLTTTETLSDTRSLGTVTGFVMNASGGTALAGTEIMLHSFDQMQIAGNFTTTLQEDGRFIFENVEMPEGRAFLATLEIGGVPYGSDVVMSEPGRTELEIPIQVYETTTDLSALSVDRLHYFFEFANEGALRVGELYIISNPGDRTLVAAGAGQPVLEFKLPPGATNLQFQDGELGERFVSTADGFGDTLPIRPGTGEYQVLFSYELPYSRKLDLQRTIGMPVQAVVILVPEDSVKVKGDGIQDAGARDVQGMQYHMYTGESMPAGGELNLTISGRPQGSSASLAESSTTSLLLGAGALGMALIAAGIWMHQRNRSASDEDDLTEEEPEPEETSAESVMDAILALDDLYQAGQLPEEAYRQRRAELKERLQRMMGNQDSQG